MCLHGHYRHLCPEEAARSHPRNIWIWKIASVPRPNPPASREKYSAQYYCTVVLHYSTVLRRHAEGGGQKKRKKNGDPLTCSSLSRRKGLVPVVSRPTSASNSRSSATFRALRPAGVSGMVPIVDTIGHGHGHGWDGWVTGSL